MTALEIPRDRFKRPLIIPPDGGKPKAYTRSSKIAELLEDSYALSQWKQQQVALGILDNQWLLKRFDEARGDWKSMNAACEIAADKAGANDKSRYGTLVHKLCERIDRGEPLGDYPAEVEADLNAYEYATREVEMLTIETFMVCDEVEAAGTPDRILKFRGKTYIGDIKTGRFSPTKWAVQFAVYAHSQFYRLTEHGAAVRTLPTGIDLETGLVIHVPAGTGTAELYWLNIGAGWEAVTEHSVWVKNWRKRKDLVWKVED